MVPFAGWEMPVQYSSILEEHRAVREAAGLFDVSHMGEVRVSGPQSENWLNHLLTNDVSALLPGRALYTVMCYEHGGVVDDLIVYRVGRDEFFLCINAGNAEKDVAWMEAKIEGWNCRLTLESSEWAQLALQGPQAGTILQGLTQIRLENIPKMGFLTAGVAQIPQVIIARTGYTGEDGFELYVPTQEAENLASVLLAAGEDAGLRLCGLGARDSLRLEAGFPLYGHELSEDITPLQAGLGWVVKWQKPEGFIGYQALQREKSEGIARKVHYFIIDDRRIARPGTAVYCRETKVGTVLSGTLSPMLQKAIGSALVPTSAGTQLLTVEIRGSHLPIRVVKPPLHLAGIS